MCYPIVFVPIKKEDKRFPEKVPVADLHRHILDALRLMFFIFIQSLGKFGQIISWRPPFFGVGPLGNTGSDNEHNNFY